MDRLRAAFRRLDVYDALSLGLIAVLLALALANWSKFPIFRDIYYHMGTARAFGDAGGIALHDFWEFAPVGRPHLYPPLLHVVMYSLDSLGFSMSTVGRLVSFSAFHMVLLSTWYGMRRLFSSRAALYGTVILSSCFVFFWQTAVTSAASLVLIITPFIFISLEEDRKVAAAVLLGLALYSHLVLGHLVAFGILIYGLHRWRDRMKEVVIVLVGAYALWLPWGIHILVNYRSLSLESPMGGSEGMTLHLLVWAAAAAGVIYCYFRKGRYYLPVSFLLGMVPILFFYPHRFWDGHVFVPLAMLGGIALSAAHGFVTDRARDYAGGSSGWKVAVVAAMSVPVALLLMVDPVFATRGGARKSAAGALKNRLDQAAPGPGMGQAPPPGGLDIPAGVKVPGRGPVEARSSTLLSLLGAGQHHGSQSLDAEPILDEGTGELAALVAANSEPGQVVHTMDPSLGNLITGLTGRPTTGGMFREVSSTDGGSDSGPGPGSDAADRLEDSWLVVVPDSATSVVDAAASGIKPPGMQLGGAGAEKLKQVDLSELEYVGAAGDYAVYRNPAASDVRTSGPGTVIGWWVVYSLLAAALILVVIDWVHPLLPTGNATKRPDPDVAEA